MWCFACMTLNNKGQRCHKIKSPPFHFNVTHLFYIDCDRLEDLSVFAQLRGMCRSRENLAHYGISNLRPPNAKSCALPLEHGLLLVRFNKIGFLRPTFHWNTFYIKFVALNVVRILCGTNTSIFFFTQNANNNFNLHILQWRQAKFLSILIK